MPSEYALSLFQKCLKSYYLNKLMIICKINSQSISLTNNSPYTFSQKSQHYSKFSPGYDYSRQYNGQINLIKFASYRIGFCSVSQNYTVWCEHTFPSNIYVEYEFKNFEHYFNLFWWKKQPFEKKTRESTSIVITKQCRKY